MQCLAVADSPGGIMMLARSEHLARFHNHGTGVKTQPGSLPPSAGLIVTELRWSRGIMAATISSNAGSTLATSASLPPVVAQSYPGIPTLCCPAGRRAPNEVQPERIQAENACKHAPIRRSEQSRSFSTCWIVFPTIIVSHIMAACCAQHPAVSLCGIAESFEALQCPRGSSAVQACRSCHHR